MALVDYNENRVTMIPLRARAGYWADDGDYIGGGPTPMYMEKEVVFTLELLTQKMARFSPEARISILEMEFFKEAQITLAGLLSELDYEDQMTALQVGKESVMDNSELFVW